MNTSPRTAAALLFATLLPLAVWAQQGDRKGHVMAPPPEEWNLPAPVLAPAEALKSFRFGQKGFALELVAAEPMVQNPVSITFDGNGRPWVCEMLDYMPDIDGNNEDAKTGRISILLDRDGDGSAEEAKVFLDGLHQPRALQFVEGGILWGDQEKLYFTERTGPGGLEAGSTEVINDDWTPGGNVEHKANGLFYALDNWIYNAKSHWRYRRVDGEWTWEKTEFRGQWGISQDDMGRLVTNSNSNLVSRETGFPGVTIRNPHHDFRSATSARIDNRVFPIRITCGINRGYQEGMLDERGFLTKATGASGITIYRGDQFPDEYYENAFIPEPTGLLLKRAILEEVGGIPAARAAYPDREFLASLDERSRFVSAHTAPDGTLYLVDMYHGIIQHRTYVTTYLRNQLVKRGLDKDNVHRGRIYRVRFQGRDLGPQPQMEEESSEQLVAYLEHPNGWWRDTAQRIIVQRGDTSAVSGLREMLQQSANWKARVHALWTLEGLGVVSVQDVAQALEADAQQVVVQGLRVAEGFAGREQEEEMAIRIQRVDPGQDAAVRMQLAASLGRFPGADAALVQVLKEKYDPRIWDLALSGLAGREEAWIALALEHELGFAPELAKVLVNRGDQVAVERVLAQWSERKDAGEPGEKLLKSLGRAAVERRKKGMVEVLLTFAAEQEGKGSVAIWEGMAAGGKKSGFKKIPVNQKMAALLPEGEAKAGQVAKLLEFGGKAPKSYLTTKAHQKQYEVGATEYAKLCAACHHPQGKGMPTLGPPLANSEWVVGSETRLIALTMEGLMGPITVAGKVYQAPEIQPVMPGLRMNPEMTDEKLASIFTYIRNSWGNAARPVEAKSVKKWRDDVAPRLPFTEAELLELK